MAKTRRSIKRRFPRRSGNIFNTVINSATRVLGNPMFLVAIAVSLYLYTNPKIITDFCSKFEKSELLKPIFDFISTHTKQTAAFILAGTAALTTLPPRFSFAGFIILGFIVYLAPEADYLEYFCLTSFSILFIRIRNIRARIILVVLAVLTIAIGWWGTKLFGLKAASG